MGILQAALTTILTSLHSASSAATAAAASSDPVLVAAPLALSLWLPFNGSLSVRHANLSTAAVAVHGPPAVSFVEAPDGVGGQAALLPAATTLSVPAPCVLPWAAATVMGWWRLADGGTANELLRIGNQELAVTGPVGKPKHLCLMSGGVDVGGWKWGYLCKACPGLLGSEWTHLAITWDAAGNQQLFANGTLLGTQLSKHTPSQPWGVSDVLTLGSGAAVSQLTVWADVLGASTIAAAAATPRNFDGQLDAATPEPRGRNSSGLGRSVQLRLATFPAGLTGSIVELGDAVLLQVSLTSVSDSDAEVNVDLSVWDVWGAAVGALTTKTATVKANGTIAVPFSVVGPKRGVFRVAAAVSSRTTSELLDQRDVGSFAVWPVSDSSQPCRSGFFGSHVNAWSGGLFVNQSLRLGQCGGQRDHDMLQATLFNEVEPTHGNFSFAGDTQLNHFARAGVPVLGSLAGTPAWAANKSAEEEASVPRTSAVPKPELFRSYVQAVVKHYSSSVRAWELWNEPSQDVFFAGTPQEYAALAKIARTEITAMDPQALLVVGGFTATEVDWQQAAAQAGALAVADVISFHYGADIPLPAAGGVAEYLATLTALIDRFHSLASNTTNLRLWNSEGGTRDSTFLVNMPLEVGLPPAQCLPSASFLRGAQSVVQAEAVMQHLGLEKHFVSARTSCSFSRLLV